jgi:hypothetical protein
LTFSDTERLTLIYVEKSYATASSRIESGKSCTSRRARVNPIFDKLSLSQTTGYSRCVLAVLRYLGA